MCLKNTEGWLQIHSDSKGSSLLAEFKCYFDVESVCGFLVALAIECYRKGK